MEHWPRRPAAGVGGAPGGRVRRGARYRLSARRRVPPPDQRPFGAAASAVGRPPLGVLARHRRCAGTDPPW